jgi:hypothetical protein
MPTIILVHLRVYGDHMFERGPLEGVADAIHTRKRTPRKRDATGSLRRASPFTMLVNSDRVDNMGGVFAM